MSSEDMVIESENVEEGGTFNTNRCVCMEGQAQVQAQGPSGQARSTGQWVSRVMSLSVLWTMVLCFSRHAQSKDSRKTNRLHMWHDHTCPRYESWLDVVYKMLQKRSSCWQLR